MNRLTVTIFAALLTPLATGCPPPVTQDDAIVLGAVIPYTGSLGADGQGIENALTLALNQVNGAGGVLGKQLRLEVRDSGTDPAQAGTAAQALIDEGVTIIFGEDASGVTLAMSEVTTSQQVVQIAGSSTSAEITTVDDDGFLFRTVVSDAFQGAVLAQALVDDGIGTVSIIHTENVYGGGLADVIETGFEALGGQVLAKASSAEGLANDYDFQADLDVVFAGNPDAIVLIAYDTDAAGYLKAWNANGGFNGSWYMTDACKVDGLISNVGAAALEGVRGTAPVFGGGAGATSFREAYQSTFNSDPDLFGENFYDAALLASLAIAKAGAVDGPSVRDALPGVAGPAGEVFGVEQIAAALTAAAAGEDVDLDGASGPVDLDADGDVAGAVELWSVESGAFVQLSVVQPE